MTSRSFVWRVASLSLLSVLVGLTACGTMVIPLKPTPLPRTAGPNETLSVGLQRDRATEIAPVEAVYGSHSGDQRQVGGTGALDVPVMTPDSLQDWIANGLELELRARGYGTRQSSDPPETDLVVRFVIESVWVGVTRRSFHLPSSASAATLRVRVELTDSSRGAVDVFVVDADHHESGRITMVGSPEAIEYLVGLLAGAREQFARAACDRIDAFASGAR